MATLKGREGTNLMANRRSAPSSPQRTNSFDGRRSSAPSSPPPQRTSSFDARRSSAPSSPQRTSSFNGGRRSSAPSSPQRASSFNGRRSPRPSNPEISPLPPAGARPASPANAAKSTRTLQPTPTTAATKRVPVTKPGTEKPPSPSPRPSRALSSPNLLKEGLTRLPYLEKVPKIPSGAKPGQLARTRSLGPANEASAAAAAASVPRIIGSSMIPVPKFASSAETVQLSRTMSLGSTTMEVSAATTPSPPTTVDTDEGSVTQTTEQEQDEGMEPSGHTVAAKLDEEQDTVDSAPILDHHNECQELNNNVEEVIDDSMQQEEEEQEEVVVREAEEDSKVDEAEDTLLESKPADRAEENEPATEEPVTGEAKPAAKFVRSASMAAMVTEEPATGEAKPATKFVRSASMAAAAKAKKESQSHNDVIEEAKSKLLEKRKNKVLALVGAFETVMALQEADGQQPKVAE